MLKLWKTLEKRASLSLLESGIHYTDFDVLATLRRTGYPYELAPKVLMKSVLITSGAMTALLDRLTKHGLIVRSSDSDDDRLKKVGLTKKGIELIDKAIEIRFIEAKDSISELTDAEKKVLVPILRKLLVSLA